MYSYEDAESGKAQNGNAPFIQPQARESGLVQSPPQRDQQKKGISVLRMLLIGIAAGLLAVAVLWSVLAGNSLGLQSIGQKGSGMRGRLKGFPRIKRIMQRHRGHHHLKASRTLKAHAASGEVPGGETHAGAEDPVTKEVDLEHLVHAGFDPEAAAHEDGLDPEDLGYDEEDSDDASDDWGQHGGHGGAGQEGAHDNGGLHESHADGDHHNGGPRVGDDSTLHAGEVTAPHHRGQAVQEHGVGTHLPGHDAPVDSSGHKLATPPGGWRSGSEEQEGRHHKIRVRARLAEIFPMIDTNGDTYIDQAELLAWHDANGRNTSARRAKCEFAWADSNNDGQVTLAEYLADVLPESFKGNETAAEVDASPVWKDESHGWIHHSKDTFDLADADRSGGLNPEEHFAFTHPEDSRNEGLHAYMRRQDVSDRDHNKDGQLDFEEFHNQVYHSLVEWDKPGDTTDDPDPHEAEKARARFKQLDVNGDGLLTEAELKPIFHQLHPTEHDYARIQALHQLAAADNSGDGRLTLTEMISNPYVFYSSSIIDGDEEDEYEAHDEF